MDWWDAVGNMYAFMPDAPALAYDMALNGPDPDRVGYDLAYGLQAASTPIEVYPPEEMSFAPEA